MMLLDLPTELLDHIFSYLDWDRETDLFPIKPDIINAASTCRQLRRVLVPVLFKDVVLRLRWSEGVLVEPCLFRLRREYPEVAKHIRCIFIRTEFEQFPHCAIKGNPTAFTVPPEIDDWLNPSGRLDDEHILQAAYRNRADAIAQRLQPLLKGVEATHTSVESIIRRAHDLSQFSVAADALSIGIMLCVPVSTQTIVFQSLPDDALHQPRNDFATQVLAMAIEMLSNNLKDLILVSTSLVGVSHRALWRTHGLSTSEDPPLLKPEVVNSLNLNRLTLALTDHPYTTNHRTQLCYDSVRLWHGASDNIRELDIRNVSSEFNETLRCIKGFQLLEVVRFQESALYLPRPPIVVGQQRAEPQQNTWLVFLIELRQAMQHVKIEINKVYTFPTNTTLPASALKWIRNEAVPTGVLIDADRQERLLQDFDSFLPLWTAEDSDRGSQALESWTTQRSSLSDDAMSRRWR